MIIIFGPNKVQGVNFFIKGWLFRQVAEKQKETWP